MPRWPEHGGLTARRLEGFTHVEGGGLSDDADATFVVSFDAAVAAAGETVELVFDGVATVWEATLNDELVAAGTSMFASCSVDVGGLLREGGGNVLTIRCRALVDVLAEQPRRPRQQWRTRIVENAGALRFVRTAVLGRAPGFAPGPPIVGPWRPVWLVRRRAGVVGDDVVLRPRVEGRDGVLAVRAPGVEGAVVVGGVSAPLVDGVAEIRIPDVALWWPHTHGTPALYDVVLRVDGVDVGVGRTGFRTLGSDDPARCVVNDVDVFARGVVWTPVPEGEARATLELLRDAGCNMVRIPGIGVYEDAEFHDLCDELGLLVWQDFMFANMDYPVEDPGFRAQVVEEAAEVLARVGGRPSLAVLCGGSEIEQQAAMFGVDPALARGALLEELLPGAIRAAGVAGVPYVTSAPTGGAMPFHPREGVANWFGVGGYRRPLSDVRIAGVRFASECLAFANVPDDAEEHGLGVMRDVGADWDFADVRDHYLRELWGVDRSHPRYWDLARQVTGELMAHVFGDWRRAESGCGGGLILWSRDLRPGSGWGVVAVDGRPKAALGALAPVLQPQAVWITDEGLNGLDVHVANDAAAALDAVVSLNVVANGRQSLDFASIRTRVPARGVHRLSVDDFTGRFLDVSYAYRFGPPAHDAVVATLRTTDGALLGEAVHFPVGPPLEPEDFWILATWRDGAVELESPRVAWGVRIDVPGWVAEADAFTLGPGTERTVRMRPVGSDRSFRGGRVTALNLIGEASVRDPDLAPCRALAVEVSYCVVNTQQRELLVRCLDAIAAERAGLAFETEVLVLDNASTDGSAGAARRHPTVTEVVALDQRRGKGENDSHLLQRSRGRFCLLLNEDSELKPGATKALYAALTAGDGDGARVGAAGAKLLRPDGRVQPSAWRFPTPATALVGALFLHKRLTVQSRGRRTRRVDWAQSAALLVRRDAAREIGWFDPQFFVYSDEVDFCKRLADAGWATLWVPSAEAFHHEQLSTGAVPERRIVELSRNRDRYMRKHHSGGAAFVVRVLTAWTYAVRAAVATVAPGHDPKRYWKHVTATLRPSRGEGLREAAREFNRGGPTL